MATPIGYRRTGLCPTFARPTLQRDGYLLRVPLVGGLLDTRQLSSVAEVSQRSRPRVVELTNRANLQIRGLPADAVASSLDALRAVGLGGLSASLVTISPFAGRAEYQIREALLHDLESKDLTGLAPKFAVHIDDAQGTTADRAADALVRVTADGACELTVRGLGKTDCTSTQEVANIVCRLAERCMAAGPDVRSADLVMRDGSNGLAVALGARRLWSAVESRPASQLSQAVGMTTMQGGQHLALAGALFGRVESTMLSALTELLARHALPSVRVTPWRGFAFACSGAEQARDVLSDAAALGLLTDINHPAVGVVACIGARGCWQTELDTLQEAARFVSQRPTDLAPGALVHVSGCDKRCASRANAALTLLGRADNAGFEQHSAFAEA